MKKESLNYSGIPDIIYKTKHYSCGLSGLRDLSACVNPGGVAYQPLLSADPH